MEIYSQIFVGSVFLITFVLLILEKFDKTIVATAASVVVVLFGFLTIDQAIESVDFRAIGLLLGMMTLVEGLRAVKIFDLLALKLAIITRANPVKIFFLFAVSTGCFSALLDNVTTVLVTVPLLLSLCQSLNIDARPFLLSLIFLSNIGGTWTLIGDPPNILIGSQVEGMTFVAFIQFLTVPVIISGIAVLMYFKIRYRASISSPNGSLPQLFTSNLLLEHLRAQDSQLTIPRAILVKASAVMALVILCFFTHALHHLEPSLVALGGAAILLALFKENLHVHNVLERVEWSTLLFFAGLFIVVGALKQVGLLSLFSHTMTSLTSDTWILLMIVLGISAVVSGIVDNIPFVAVMIPVLKELSASAPFNTDPKAYLLWWALSLGACFGGNSTIIGASANVVSCALAKKHGVHITFRGFLKDSIPCTGISIVISGIYLTVLYFI